MQAAQAAVQSAISDANTALNGLTGAQSVSPPGASAAAAWLTPRSQPSLLQQLLLPVHCWQLTLCARTQWWRTQGALPWHWARQLSC